MKRIPGILLLLPLLLAAMPAVAQKGGKPAPKPQIAPKQQPVRITRSDTMIKSTTLEVYQLYEPELKPATKPELSPEVPAPPATRAPQQYDVPQQTLYYAYRSLPLRPLALGKDTAPAPDANYVLLGGGNISTILGEAGIGSLRGHDWQGAVQARYVTQEGDIEGQVFRSFKLKGDATWKQRDHLFEAGLDVQRSVFGAYGYNHDQVKYSFDDVRRVNSGAAITLGAANESPGPAGIRYHPSITASYFTATAIENERSLRIQLPVSRQIDSSLSASIGLNAWVTITDTGSDSRYNNVFQLTPAVSYRRRRFSGHLGLYPTTGNGNVYLLPDIHADYRIGDGSSIIASAGWQSCIVQNTAQQLLTANPFTAVIPGTQTRSDEIFGSLSIALAKHLTIWGRGGWQQYLSLPLFITRPGGDGKDFNIYSDPRVEAIVWSAGLRYAIGEDFSVGAAGTWYNYYKHTYSHVWGEPGVRLKGDASWRATSGLLITAYMEVLDRIWGRNAQGSDIRLKGVFDFGVAAEYTLVQRLNVFLRAENLLGRHNERWQGYPSFGFNIYGGVRFRF